jgi:hypothetical protein
MRDTPRWGRAGLIAFVANATHDQPVAPIGRLGDLRDPIRLVGDLNPGRFGNGGDRGADRLGLAHRDRVAHPVAAEPLDELG